MNNLTPRKALLDTLFDLMSDYLGDECPEDENFEDFDPEVDALRSEVSDLLAAENHSRASMPREPYTFMVAIEFRSGLEWFATETYRVEAADWTAAELLAFTLADDSPYSDDRIPDLTRHASDRTAPVAGFLLMTSKSEAEASHFVHVYATIRIKVAVQAADHREAMQRADHFLFGDGFAVRLLPNGPNIIDADYAEEVTGYLVDEAGDPEFLRSETYDPNGQPNDASG